MLRFMAPRTCQVTLCAKGGVQHTVQVTASSLYEAVALGIESLRREEWVGGVADRFHEVKVSATETAVEHCVKLDEFNKWVSREGGSPRDVFQRQRVREILDVRPSRAK